MGGGGGEEMEVEVPLSTGALEAMWREHGLRPVLQLAEVPQMAAEAGRYRVALSDGGERLQPGMLAASLSHLVVRGALRRGTVVRVLEHFAGFYHNQRIIIVIQLEILHAECTLILSPSIFEANTTQHIGISCSGGLAIHEPCFMPCTQQVQFISNSSYSPDKRVLDSSVTPKAELTVINLPFSEYFCSMPAQSTVDAKMQQLSLNDHQNQMFTVTAATGEMAAKLTPGAVLAISEHADGNGMLQPILQVVNVWMVSNIKTPSAECFRMVLSDGVYTLQSILATAMNTCVRDGSIHKGSIIHLQEFTCSTIQNRRFIIVSKLYVLQSECNIMGNPKPYEMRNQPNEPRSTPVSALNPYQTRWKIKARVTTKTDLRHYKNSRGPGKVFSFDLLDGQGGEIRATCFNAQADQFFDLIEVDKVYLISGGLLKPAQKKFNSLNDEYEINVDHRTSIEVCNDDDSNIPRQRYNFRQISEIENIEAGAIVDLVGIVTSVGPSATIIRKDGTETQKRTLQLKDMSVFSVEIILWGKFCDAEGHQLQLLCDSGLNPVLALKGARISGFNGRSVSSIVSTQLKIDPDFPEAESLRQWYATEGKTAACVSLSVVSMGRTDVRKAVAQIKDEYLGRSEKPDFITVKGAISHLATDNFCYPACTVDVNGRQCNKKVIHNGDGTWHCDKCDQSLPKCEYRYLLQCQIQDHTGVTYATAFQEAGIEMIGHSAHELYNIREEDAERFAEILQEVRCQQFLFKLKVKEETFNDQQRVICSIIAAEKLDPARESSYLLEVINGLLQDDTGSPSEAQGPMAYNAGLSNTGAGRSVQTSNSAYTNMSGPRYVESVIQFPQQAKTYIRAPTPDAGFANLGARQSMLTSSNASLQLDKVSYPSSNVSATGFAQSNWMPTPQLSASSDGCDFNGGFGFMGPSSVRGALLTGFATGPFSKKRKTDPR